MPRQSEPNVNNALAILFRRMFSRTDVISENTRVIADYPSLKPDILVNSIGRSPVVIEAEYLPAHTAEDEAKARLGLEVASNRRTIEAAIALRYPEDMAEATDLEKALKSSTLSYCVFTQERGGAVHRFPESGWLDGAVEDLADLVRLVSVPQWAVDEATEILRKGIDSAAGILDEVASVRPETVKDIAARLGMTDVEQTRRMACAIMANAMVFHERIAKMHPGIETLEAVCGDRVPNPQREVLAAWNDILKINYWPIFAIARDILGELQAGDATQILRQLRNTAQDINAAGVENAQDLTGRIFQNLIADRKYLATFYTLPASAALLARLAVAKMQGVDWSDKEAIGKLRVADFACGTGTLLSAVYEQIAARYERTGGNPAKLHRILMEEVLYGCDVMPSAVHITCSTLSGMEPAEKFGKSRLYALQYGRQEDGTVKIGSLEFLQTSAQWTLFNTSDPAIQLTSTGEESTPQAIANIPDKGFDMVIMNPPFTRPGSDWEGEDRTEDYIKHFRGLSTPFVTQKDMAKRLGKYAKDTCYHGYAGIASAFVALANKKLKSGGILALVLPLSAASGLSWGAFRELVSSDYAEVAVLSLAGTDNEDLSFSADTGMAECLVIARKVTSNAASDHRAHFTSLQHRPSGLAHASTQGEGLLKNRVIRRIEDGPYGGTPLMVGDDLAGEMITAPRGRDGEAWSAVRLADYSVAQPAYSLSQSKLWLPGIASPLNLNVTTVSEVGTRGWHDMNIAGGAGPFTKGSPSNTSTYPSLWSHNAKRETRLVCKPDSQLLVKGGMENRAAQAWATASRAHLNRDFRFNSQPLAAAFTERPSIGGRAWPNVVFDSKRFDYPFMLWANSTLGLLCFWWHSNRQVSGRGTTAVSGFDSLPTLDLRTFTDAQLTRAEGIFDEFRDKELLPAYLADADPNRALLDRRVICDLLGFDDDIYQGVRRLAAKWCAEPSVHGGKKRPPSAKPVS